MSARLLVVVLAVLLMSGCSLRLPGIDIGDGGGGPPHCPPGQAKKGNC
ncbi:MAG: hypothetical protein KJ881_00070 [Gammaproteobacteria bacterium]|nr:hypothetical protein [Gammaproteobacteria bacterium]